MEGQFTREALEELKGIDNCDPREWVEYDLDDLHVSYPSVRRCKDLLAAAGVLEKAGIEVILVAGEPATLLVKEE